MSDTRSRYRCDKLTREVREKKEGLDKARVDLAAELQASGGASIVPVDDQALSSGASSTPTSMSVLGSFGLGPQASAIDTVLQLALSVALYEDFRKTSRI